MPQPFQRSVKGRLSCHCGCFCMLLIYNTLHNCFMARCKRPSFRLQKMAFQTLKGHLSQSERCPFAKCPFFLMISKYYPCLPYLFSKLRRRASFSVLEYAVEVAQVVETAEETYVCYALACVEQQPCRISKAYVYKIFAQRVSRVQLEEAAESVPNRMSSI